MATGILRVFTPQVVWHCESGKNDPVFSIDVQHRENILMTSGADRNVRLWSIAADYQQAPTFLFELSNFPGVIHVARFSPSGESIAAASGNVVSIFTIKGDANWLTATSDCFTRQLVHTQLAEIYDLAWSPTSSHILAASIDSESVMIDVLEGKAVCQIEGHSGYVQGTAWDPYNGSLFATQGGDKSCRCYSWREVLKSTSSYGFKHSRHCVIRSISIAPEDTNDQEVVVTDAPTADVKKPSQYSLFADSSVPSFFRRLTWTPDGKMLICPAGMLRTEVFSQMQRYKLPHATDSSSSSSPSTKPTNFCTWVFARDNLSIPYLCLSGLDVPSIGVRCCPRLFQSNQSSHEYRMLIAVVTLDSVLVYQSDKMHTPIATVTGIHYSGLSDCCWTSDGRMLIVSSTDGYLSFLTFSETDIGSFLPADQVPKSVMDAFPCVYKERAVFEVAVKKTKRKILDDDDDDDHKVAEGEPTVVLDPSVAQEIIVDSSSKKKKKKIVPLLIGTTDVI